MAISETYEALEAWESESEATERAPVRRPSTAPSFRPRPTPGAPNSVTQAQLEASLARVDGKIKTVADSVATINSRLASVSTSSRKEEVDRKKAVEGQSKDLNQKLQMLALLPVLIQPARVDNPTTAGGPLTDAAGNPIPAVSVPDSNKLNMLLPLLMVSGLGGAGGPSLGGEGGGDSGMMMLALVLAMSR